MTTNHTTRVKRSLEWHDASRRGSATGGVPLSILFIIGLAVGVSLMFRVLTQKNNNLSGSGCDSHCKNSAGEI